MRLKRKGRKVLRKNRKGVVLCVPFRLPFACFALKVVIQTLAK